MALDRSKDYGISCGGPTNGFAVQDGKIYNHDDVEVDKHGKPVAKTKGTKTTPVAAKTEAPTPPSADLAATLAQE